MLPLPKPAPSPEPVKNSRPKRNVKGSTATSPTTISRARSRAAAAAAADDDDDNDDDDHDDDDDDDVDGTDGRGDPEGHAEELSARADVTADGATAADDGSSAMVTGTDCDGAVADSPAFRTPAPSKNSEKAGNKAEGSDNSTRFLLWPWYFVYGRITL